MKFVEEYFKLLVAIISFIQSIGISVIIVHFAIKYW